MKNQDTPTMLSLTADPCIVAGAQGVSKIDKASFMKMAENPTCLLHDFSFKDDVQVSILNDDLAIIAYDVHADMTVEGKRIPIDAAETSTWIRQNGNWVCVLHTESILGDPYGRDKKIDVAA